MESHKIRKSRQKQKEKIPISFFWKLLGVKDGHIAASHSLNKGSKWGEKRDWDEKVRTKN